MEGPREVFGPGKRYSVLHQLLDERSSHLCRYPQCRCVPGALRSVLALLREGPARRCARKICRWGFRRPKAEISHRGHPVGGIVGWIVLELFHPRPEPLVGVVVVVGDAGAEDVDQGEALVLNALFDQFSKCFCSPLKPRATNVAPAARASEIGLIGASTLPKGMLLVFMPRRLVGEVWPVVRP